MKKTYLMLLLALSGLGSGCTNDDGTTESPSGAAGEIQLVFSGSGESEEYTKAIASNSENEIKNLKVYLFASSSAEAGDDEYYYMETWSKTDATPAGNQFLLQSSGSSYKASIKPGELKGLPYLTLVCVANQDDLFKGDGNAFGALTAVTVDANGAPQNAAAATDLADFKAAYTANLAADGIIKTPLAMTGMEKTKISGSVSKVAITLKRIVARFDIDNTTATSRLTITHIALGQGRPNASLFGAALAEVTPPAGVMTYADVEYKGENANQGTLESALYVYPNLATDKSFLIIKGTYSSPSTGQPIDVTYNIPIVKTPEDATPTDPANYIAVNANSRYKLHITDVTESNIFSTFEVEDWTSGGGVIVKPENAKPELKELTTGTITPTLIAGTTGQYKIAEDDGTFSIVITSTGTVKASTALATKAVSETDWLKVSETPTVEVVDGVTVTTFPVKVEDATGKQPVAVTFINEAASYDPDLQTTLTFYGPLAPPVVTEVLNGHSTGNTVDLSVPTAMTAKMYQVVNSEVQVNVMCVDGITTMVPDGFSVAPVTSGGSTDPFTTTYSIKVTDTDQAAASDKTIKFKNKGDASGAILSSLVVTLADPALTFDKVTDAKDAITVNQDTKTIQIDLDQLSTGNFTFKVAAPLGLGDTPSLDCPWLTITETVWNESDKYALYTVAAKGGTPANYDDFTLAFTNKLAGGPGLTVTLNKAASKPKFAANDNAGKTNSIFNDQAGVFTDPYASTASMYNANGSVIYVKLTCQGSTVDVESSDLGVTIAKENDTDDIYKITVGSGVTANSVTITARNHDDSSRSATLTVTLVSAAITVEVENNANIVKSMDGNNIVYTIDQNIGFTAFTVTVTAPKGATVSGLDSFAASAYLKKDASNAGDETIEAGVSEVYTLKIGDPDAAGDITLDITNTLNGGGDQKIIFKKKI